MTQTKIDEGRNDQDKGEPALDAGPDAIASALSRNLEWEGEAAKADWIQTHISHVFLTAERVFKLRKAVQLPFLDFSTRDARNADCVREVALNRRLAPDVYLGLAPLYFDGITARLGPATASLTDSNLEHVVVMRRLPEGRDALSLLDENQLSAGHLEAVAAELADFHAREGLGRPAPWTPEAWMERIAKPTFESLAAIASSKLVSDGRIEVLENRLRERVADLGPLFESRRLEGRAVDAHGDLHLDHVWFEKDDAPPLMIDCIEFNEDLRRIDRASEVAFLAMDLAYRGRSELAEWFLGSYAMHTDDYGIFSVVDFFAAYRALVRAKVAALAAGQTSIAEEQRDKARSSVEHHFALAESLLTPRSTPAVVLLCGTVGSGKSTVARYLAQTGCGIPIASDRVRKAMAGIPATSRVATGTDEGLYEPGRTDDVYRALLARAEQVVDSGRTALLDASFAQSAHREIVRRWALDRGLSAKLIEVRCRPETALARLRKRKAANTDPSDAGPDFLPVSQARFEKPDEWPALDHEVVWTD